VQRGEEPLKVFVIAEAGINHNGELKLAKNWWMPPKMQVLTV